MATDAVGDKHRPCVRFMLARKLHNARSVPIAFPYVPRLANRFHVCVPRERVEQSENVSRGTILPINL